MKPIRFRAVSSPGFSLVELLVALAVFALMMLAISYILNSAGTTAAQLSNHQNADVQARTVFDRMALDFAQMVKRNDIDYIFFPNTEGNDSIYFFSEAPSYNNATYKLGQKNTVSLVGYRINSDAADVALVQPMELERLGKTLTWDSTGPQLFYLGYYAGNGTNPPQLNGTTILTYNGGFYKATLGTAASGYSDGKDPDFHPLGTQVLRMKISFLLQDGTQSNIPMIQSAMVPAGGAKAFNSAATWPLPSDDSAKYYAKNSRWYDTGNKIGYICTDPSPGAAIWKQIGLQDIKAIIVTIAVLDQQGIKIIGQTKNYTTQLANFAGKFPSIPIDTTTGMVTTASLPAKGTSYTAGDVAGYLVYNWNQEILPGSGLSTATGLPQNVISQIRVYQRYFYLNTF